MRTLLDAEWVGGIPMLQGAALISGYYMNEWLRRALAQADAHAGLFDAYQRGLAELSLHAHSAGEQAQVLRGFELSLLRELGFAPNWVDCAQDAPEVRYRFEVAQHRWVRVDEPVAERLNAGAVLVTVQTIRDIGAGRFDSARTQQEAKQLFQAMLAQHIADKPLLTRQMARELQALLPKESGL